MTDTLTLQNSCPFCDGVAVTRSTLDVPACWFAVCLSCDAMTGYSTSEEGAAIIWNRVSARHEREFSRIQATKNAVEDSQYDNDISQTAVGIITDLIGPYAAQSGTNCRVVEDHLRQLIRIAKATAS